MNFKPNKNKVKISIIVALVWYLFLFVYFTAICSVSSKVCLEYLEPCDGCVFKLIPLDCGVHCYNCPNVIDIFLINLLHLAVVLIPGLLVYGIWSLVEKKRKRQKKKGQKKQRKKRKRGRKRK